MKNLFIKILASLSRRLPDFRGAEFLRISTPHTGKSTLYVIGIKTGLVNWKTALNRAAFLRLSGLNSGIGRAAQILVSLYIITKLDRKRNTLALFTYPPSIPSRYGIIKGYLKNLVFGYAARTKHGEDDLYWWVLPIQSYYHLPLRDTILNAILLKLALTLNVLSVVLAATPSNEIALNPPINASSTLPSIIDLIEQNFLPMGEKVAKTALRIATCESRLIETAKNPHSTASGVFQILTGTFKRYSCSGSVMDAEDNIQCAARIRQIQGNWSDWDESRACWQ